MTPEKKNRLWLASHYISTMVLSFVSLKLNLENFGTEIFGVWVLFSSLFVVGGTIDFGFGLSLIRFIAEAHGNRNSKQITILSSNALVLYIVFGICISAVTSIIAFFVYLPNHNLVPVQYTEFMPKLILLLAGVFFVQYINTCLKSCLEGMNGFAASSKRNIVFNVLNFIGSLIVYIAQGSVIHLVGIYLLNSLFLTASLMLLIHRSFPSLRFSFGALEFASMKPIFKFSTAMQLSTLLSALFDPLIKFLLGNHASLHIVSYYEIARRLSTAAAGLYTAAMRTFLVTSSTISDEKSYNKFFLTEIRDVANLGIYYAAVVFGIGSFFAAAVIAVWFKHEEIIFLYLLLTLPEIVNSCAYPVYIFFYGIGRPFLLAYFQLINMLAATSVIAISLIFYKSTLGLLGITLGTGLNFFIMLSIARQYSGLTILGFLKTIKFVKFILLFSCFCIVILLLAVKGMSYVAPLAVLSVISFALFFTDLKQIAIPVITKIFVRN